MECGAWVAGVACLASKRPPRDDQSRNIWQRLRACRLRSDTPLTVRTGGWSTTPAVGRFEFPSEIEGRQSAK